MRGAARSKAPKQGSSYVSECDVEPSAAPVPGRSPWPRAPLSGACSFARSNALLRAVFEEKALTEKALLKHLDGKADGKKVAKVEKGEEARVVGREAVVREEVERAVERAAADMAAARA